MKFSHKIKPIKFLAKRLFSKLKPRHPDYLKDGKGMPPGWLRSKDLIPDFNKTENRRFIPRKMSSLVSFCFFVAGFTMLSMPLYRMLCQSLGWDGSVSSSSRKISKEMRRHNKRVDERLAKTLPPLAEDELRIDFAARAETNDLIFTPNQKHVWMTPGESSLVFFTVENVSDKNITALATYTVHPYRAAPYFTKIQCFCFEEQFYRANQKIELPVLFYVNPEIREKDTLRKVNRLTLLYTLHDVSNDYCDEE